MATKKSATDDRPYWRRRMDKLQAENRCISCGVDKDLIQAARDDNLEDFVLGSASQSELTFEVHDRDGNLVAAFADETHASGWREVMHLPDEPSDESEGEEPEETEAETETETEPEEPEAEAEAEQPEELGDASGEATADDPLAGRVGPAETKKDRSNRLRREKRAAAKS